MNPYPPNSGGGIPGPPPISAGTLSPFEQTTLYYLSRMSGRLDDILWLLWFIAAMAAVSVWLLFTRL